MIEFDKTKTPEEISDILYECHSKLIDRNTGIFQVQEYLRYIDEIMKVSILYPNHLELEEHKRIAEEYKTMYLTEIRRN